MIHRHIKVEKHESSVRRLPGVYLENPSYSECPGRRDIQRMGQRHTLMQPPCSQKYLVKPYWGVKERFSRLTLDKGAEVPGNLHTRPVAVVLS